MYKRVETEQLVERLSDIKGLDFASAKRIHMRGTKHCLKVPVTSNIMVKNDLVKPELLLINSYNQESSLFVGIGMYRFVCSNGLVVGTDLYSERVRHVDGRTLDTFLSEYEEKVQSVIEYIGQDFRRNINKMVAKEISLLEAITAIEKLKQDSVVTIKAAEQAARIYNYNEFKREADFEARNTVWGLYNVLNECLEDTRTKRTSDGRLLARNNILLPAILAA